MKSNDNNAFQVDVMLLTGKVLPIMVQPTDSVATLKQKIFKHKGAPPPYRQNLLVMGRILNPDTGILRDCKLKAGNTVYITAGCRCAGKCPECSSKKNMLVSIRGYIHGADRVTLKDLQHHHYPKIAIENLSNMIKNENCYLSQRIAESIPLPRPIIENIIIPFYYFNIEPRLPSFLLSDPTKRCPQLDLEKLSKDEKKTEEEQSKAIEFSIKLSGYLKRNKENIGFYAIQELLRRAGIFREILLIECDIRAFILHDDEEISIDHRSGIPDLILHDGKERSVIRWNMPALTVVEYDRLIGYIEEVQPRLVVRQQYDAATKVSYLYLDSKVLLKNSVLRNLFQTDYLFSQESEQEEAELYVNHLKMLTELTEEELGLTFFRSIPQKEFDRNPKTTVRNPVFVSEETKEIRLDSLPSVEVQPGIVCDMNTFITNLINQNVDGADQKCFTEDNKLQADFRCILSVDCQGEPYYATDTILQTYSGITQTFQWKDDKSESVLVPLKVTENGIQVNDILRTTDLKSAENRVKMAKTPFKTDVVLDTKGRRNTYYTIECLIQEVRGATPLRKLVIEEKKSDVSSSATTVSASSDPSKLVQNSLDATDIASARKSADTTASMTSTVSSNASLESFSLRHRK